MIKNLLFNKINKKTIKHKDNICFIHIPKTSGKTTISVLTNQLGMVKLNKCGSFKNFCNSGVVTFGHVHYLSLIKSGYVSNEFHLNSYKFSIVRSPYERIASLYNYLATEKKLSIETGVKDWDFDFFLDRVMNRRPPIGLYNTAGISQTNPQVDWIIDEDGDWIVNDIFKIEDLQPLHRKFAETYGVSFDNSYRKNQSRKLVSVEKNIMPVRERVEKVEFIYARDFDLLGYDRFVF